MPPTEPDRPLTSAELAAIARVPLADGWTYDRPICEGETCICGQRGDEIARGVFYFHARCVRLVASRVVALKVEALTALAEGPPPSSLNEQGTDAGQIVIDTDGSFHQANARGELEPPLAKGPHGVPAHPNPPVDDSDRFLAALLFTGPGVEHLDALARQHTASRTFLDLVIDPGGVPWYRPSLRGGAGRPGRERAELADAYDRYQAERGDPRRAFREG